MQLNQDVVSLLSVRPSEAGTSFYYNAEKIMTILALTDADREEQAIKPGCTVLYMGETVIYVAIWEDTAPDIKTINDLIARFHPIRVDLNKEED